MTITILGILGITLTLFIIRPVTTFIHELGHAIPALFFTKEEVVIYVGSYGDTDKSIIWKIGRLSILFRYKITDWQLGVCWHGRTPKIIQNFLIILGGPVFSLILGIVSYLLILQYRDHTFLTFLLAALLVSGLLDFVVNMIPRDHPLEMHDGHLVLSDGGQLLYYFKVMNYPPSYFEGLDLLEEYEVDEGVKKLKATIDAGKKDLSLYRLILEILEDQPEKALAFNDQYFREFKLQSPDFKQLGDLYAKINESSFAIQCYTEAIRLNYKNQSALIERAKLYIDAGLENKAMDDLKIALLIIENKEAKALMDRIG
ncbi:MAG: hypothetical protein ACI8VT_001797 [Saprospiraceae bacterium]|jgi:hypothetical protein